MKNRDRGIMLAVFTCTALFGIVAGYLVFGPLRTAATETTRAYYGYAQQDTPYQTLIYAETLYPPATVYAPPEATTMQATPPAYRYLVTSRDGQIVVYYADTGGKAHTRVNMIVNTSVAALPQEEQALLLQGILVHTEDELFRILEDYGS